jgi:hypothetical protein
MIVCVTNSTYFPFVPGALALQVGSSLSSLTFTMRDQRQSPLRYYQLEAYGCIS